MIAHHFYCGERFSDAIKYYIQSVEQLALLNQHTEILKILEIIFKIDQTNHLLPKLMKLKLLNLQGKVKKIFIQQ